MLLAHLKTIMKLDRLRLRGQSGARDESPRRHRPEPPETRQVGSRIRPATGLVGLIRHPKTKGPNQTVERPKLKYSTLP
jgi:hypothetical protein